MLIYQRLDRWTGAIRLSQAPREDRDLVSWLRDRRTWLSRPYGRGFPLGVCQLARGLAPLGQIHLRARALRTGVVSSAAEFEILSPIGTRPVGLPRGFPEQRQVAIRIGIARIAADRLLQVGDGFHVVALQEKGHP